MTALLRIASLLYTLLLASAAAAQPVGPHHAKAVAAAKPVFLWELRSPTATVYLLGSVHVASGDMYPLDARIERAFQKSETLVLEKAPSGQLWVTYTEDGKVMVNHSTSGDAGMLVLRRADCTVRPPSPHRDRT